MMMMMMMMMMMVMMNIMMDLTLSNNPGKDFVDMILPNDVGALSVNDASSNY